MSLIKEDMKEIKRCGKTEKYKKEGKATKLNKKGRTPYYIFINRRFTPLHPSAWNKELKKLFIEAGISVENGHGNSLSHRFRHAFAVRYIYIYKKDRSVVSHLLGHTSYMSLQQYDHPPKELLLEFMSLKSLGRLSEIEDWEFVDDTDEERRLNDILWS
jgi:site-specific recombinase XerD